MCLMVGFEFDNEKQEMRRVEKIQLLRQKRLAALSKHECGFCCLHIL